MAVAESLYYTWKDERTPWKVKAMIVGGLAYLLNPLDVIPDLLPGGFFDDLGVLLSLLSVAGSVGREHHERAREKYNLKGESEPSLE